MPQLKHPLLQDVSSRRQAQDPEAYLLARLLPAAITRQLATLPPRQRYILEERFGLRGQRPRTCQEIGQDLDLSTSRVSQHSLSALRKLRHGRRGGQLLDFIPDDGIRDDVLREHHRHDQDCVEWKERLARERRKVPPPSRRKRENVALHDVQLASAMAFFAFLRVKQDQERALYRCHGTVL